MTTCCKCGINVNFFTRQKRGNKYYCMNCFKQKLKEIEEQANTHGYIRYFNLLGWWFDELTIEERIEIENVYKLTSLIQDRITSTRTNVVSFLSILSGYFKSKEHKTIGYKILDMAERRLSPSKNILDIHFFYHAKIELYYKNRDEDDYSYEIAKKACLQQIECSEESKKAFIKEAPKSPLPSHTGYSQLCIIYEKEKKYQECIDLSQKALKQGWTGDDWSKRIERCKSKINE